MKIIKHKVKDIEWSFQILENEAFENKHGKGAHGITDKEEFEVDFRFTSFSLKLVKHEVFHTYVGSCCIGSIDNLNSDDMEEISAEIHELHDEDMKKLATKVYNSLKSPKDTK